MWSPISQVQTETQISYIDSVFTTASAFSDTGLVVKDTFKHWNDLGQAVIAILILSGGIGIFALKFFFINYLFGHKTSSFNEMKLLQTERGGTDNTKTTRLIISSVKFIFFNIFIFSIILTIYFFYAEPRHTEAMKEFLKPGKDYINPQGNFLLSLKFGIFHTISAINNAGFDIISNASLMPYYQNYELQIIFIILLIIGGIGYPAIYDIASYIKHKYRRNKEKFRFSLFTKVSLTAYTLIFVLGFIPSIIFESSSQDPFSLWNQYYIPTNASETNVDVYVKWFKEGQNLQNIPTAIKPYIDKGYIYGSNWDKSFAVIFTTFSTRSAGFATINLKHLTSGTTFIYIIMMVIGSAPASTGGGIRTTTAALIIMSMIRILFGLPRVRMFKRAINKDTVNMASQILAIAVMILIIASLILSSSFDTYGGQIHTYSQSGNANNAYTIDNIIFEVASAFGTTGLSSGITKDLNIASKIALILVMFIGQFGISSTLLVWKRKNNYKRTYEYVDGDFAIG
ncbi:potassium transporter TrkG [Mycoplasma sp. Pen4]|uniref:potassium transporter TrkG n=1 Tax=Mycoplasma sp. Pen4 TaxID=640330 RepID=UPI0021022BC1|nr:potassium transporter TrkG [Mycoplasma sp. Pen4]